MKLNLPSTSTQQKMNTLFLLTLLSANKVKSGQNFKNCLTQTRTNTNYNFLVNFPFNTNSINSGLTMILCCDNSQCFSKTNSSLCSAVVSPWTGTDFHCNKINQSVVCVDIHGGCCGVVGDTPITSNTTLGACANNIVTVANYISNIAVANNNGYDYWICPANSPCSGSVCDWDNGGWTCLSQNSLGCKVNSDGNYACDTSCNLQWMAPNPFSVTSSATLSNVASSSSVISSTDSVSSTVLSTDSPNLIIVIPATVGGSVLIITTAGCYLYKKRKKLQQQKQENIQLEEVPELPTNYEGSNALLLPVRRVQEFNNLNEEQYLQKPQEVYFGKPQEESFLQKPYEQYQAQIEVAGSSFHVPNAYNNY